MPNAFIATSLLLKESLSLFLNANHMLRTISRRYSNEFGRQGYKVGGTIRVRKPVDWTIRTGATFAAQDIQEQSINVTIGTQVGVDFSWTSADQYLTIDDISDRYLATAMNSLAGKVATDIMTMLDANSNDASQGGACNLIHSVDGSGNTVPPTYDTWLGAGAILDIQSAPQAGRFAVGDPYTIARANSQFKGFFNDQATVGRQFKEGGMPSHALGFDWYMDQTVPKHTTGTFSAGTVNGASQTGQTITLNAITGTLKKGDIITFAGVNSVNRVTHADNGTLAQFVVTADVATSGTSVSIYPPLTPPSGGNPVQYQTVTASPANSAALAMPIVASEVYRKAFVTVPETMCLVWADLDEPNRAVQDWARMKKDGISVRMITDYVFTTDTWATRFDAFYGKALLRPEWVVIVADSLT